MRDNIRDVCFTIRLSSAEYNALKRISEQHNTTMAGYIRFMAIDALLSESEAEKNV